MTTPVDRQHGLAASHQEQIAATMNHEDGETSGLRGSQDGLGWKTDGLDLEPVWTREPSLLAIETGCRQHLQIPSEQTCSVSFHAEGAFNKLYLIHSGESSWLMRVSLPVCPHDKTRSEVTTMEWIRENTDIPVPKVFAFSDSSTNEIGFEWILMELMPGQTAYSRWRKMTMSQKVFLTQRMAEFQAQLFRHNFPSAASFRGIGSLDSSDSANPTPGRFINSDFFMGNRIKLDVPRGPFCSSHDWLKASLEVAHRDGEAYLAAAVDDDEREEAERCIEAARRLRDLLPRIFPSLQHPPERTALYHHDLGLANILIDEHGDITAVLDWECVSALPLWRLTRSPRFLYGEARDEEPKRDEYADADEPSPGMKADPDKLDDEGKGQLYWIHLMDYEQTQLRKIYHDKMESLWPGWALEVADNQLKQDFYDAVSFVGNGLSETRIIRWVDKLEAGEVVDFVPGYN